MPREHRCEKCGCSESRACPGGCAWDPTYLKRGRHLCTRCTGFSVALEELD